MVIFQVRNPVNSEGDQHFWSKLFCPFAKKNITNPISEHIKAAQNTFVRKSCQKNVSKIDICLSKYHLCSLFLQNKVRHTRLWECSTVQGTTYIYLVAANILAVVPEGVVEALAEDLGHEAVDEEVGRGVDHHGQLWEVAHQQDPEWETVTVVIQS